MRILIDKEKKFFKANLHTHTIESDGLATPEEIKAAYKSKGYSIVAYTEHDHITNNSALNDVDFLTITSLELAIKEFETVSSLVKTDMKVCHLNLYSLDPNQMKTPCYSSVYNRYLTDKNKDLLFHDGEYERVYSKDGINEIIRIANKNGFLVSYNHPGWSLEDSRTYLEYDNLFAVEIYNTSCVKNGIPDDEVVFDHFLREGKKIFCTACDDCHTLHSFGSPYNDSFGGWVMINADKLDYSTIMNALKNGDFYASTGPEIYSLTEDNGTVRVECSPAKSITLVTGTRRAKTVFAQQGEFVNSSEFTVDENDFYFRIRVEDENGKKAYSQATFIKSNK